MDMKQLRERKNLKLRDVAYHLRVSETSVRHWEHGRATPRLTFEQMETLMNLYGCSVAELRKALDETFEKSA